MSQSWKTELLSEINEYMRTKEYVFAKNALKKGYMTPDGHGQFKLTNSGERFIQTVRLYLRKEKKKT